MWFKFKLQITWQAGNGGTKNVKITVAVKYLNNFWRTSEIPLVNCEISLQLKWFKDFFFSGWYCSKSNANISNNWYKTCLSNQGNVQLLKQLESGFKRTINWNKYQPKKKQ